MDGCIVTWITSEVSSIEQFEFHTNRSIDVAFERMDG